MIRHRLEDAMMVPGKADEPISDYERAWVELLAGRSVDRADLAVGMIATMERYRWRDERGVEVEIDREFLRPGADVLPAGQEATIPYDLWMRIVDLRAGEPGSVVRRAVKEWLDRVGRPPMAEELDEWWEKVSALDDVEIQRCTLPSRPVQGWAEIERLQDIASVAESLRDRRHVPRWLKGGKGGKHE